jgi:hypothetical protein
MMASLPSLPALAEPLMKAGDLPVALATATKPGTGGVGGQVELPLAGADAGSTLIWSN